MFSKDIGRVSLVIFIVSIWLDICLFIWFKKLCMVDPLYKQSGFFWIIGLINEQNPQTLNVFNFQNNWLVHNQKSKQIQISLQQQLMRLLLQKASFCKSFNLRLCLQLLSDNSKIVFQSINYIINKIQLWLRTVQKSSCVLWVISSIRMISVYWNHQIFHNLCWKHNTFLLQNLS